MIYYLYEVKNVINNKIYVGVHRTNNLNDGYMGSGNIIKRAIKKYELQNFTKTILEEFTDSKSMYKREKEYVNDEFLKRKDIYNLRCGGLGGFDHINNDPILNQKRLDGIQLAIDEHRIGCQKNWSEETRKSAIEQCHKNTKIAAEASKKYWLNMSEEERKRRSEQLSKIMSGNINASSNTHFYINPETKELVRYKEGKQPTEWITTTEYKEIQMKNSPRWYNDGLQNYYIFTNNPKIIELNLIKGRIKAQRFARPKRS